MQIKSSFTLKISQMNRNFTLALLLVLAFVFRSDAQAVRRVLIEEFTSATCGPCAATNPIFDPFLKTFGNQVTALKYQSYIPVTGDPMYGQNTPESQARHSFYGINSAPSCRMDGVTPHNGHPINLVANPTPLTTRLAVTSPIELTVDHKVTLETGKDSIEINISIKNVSSTDFTGANYVLQTVITEEEIKFPRQAATNGETEFSHVMRKMIPNASGTRITQAIAPGQTQDFRFKVPLPAYLYSVNQIAVVAFVQNAATSSKEIFQSAHSAPKAPEGNFLDVAMIKGTMKNRVDQCDNSVSFDVEIENVSTDPTPITSIDFVQLNGGVARPRVNWTGNLMPGDKAVATFNNLPLNLGSSTFNFYIERINGGAVKDRNVVNNFQKQIPLLTFPSATNGNNLNEGFENGTGTTPVAKTYVASQGLRIFRASAAQGNNFPYPMGGFGQSVWNMFFAFSDQGVAGASASLYFDKIDLSQGVKTEATWNYAYATKALTDTDKMELLVSKDCGDTWTSVYSNSGTFMASVPEVDVVNSHIPGFWLPLPDQWKAEKVDLSAFDGTPELLVQFKGTAGNGWAYFLDDVKIQNAPSSTNNPGNITDMKVFPNPVSDLINLDVRMSESTRADIRLYDMQGKMVSLLANGKQLNVGSNTLSFPVDVNAGIYQIELRTSKGVQTHKISIL